MQTQSSKAESPLSPQQAKGLAMRVSLVSVAVNLVLSAGKLLAGVFAHSGAMISDAVHSASDVFSTLIVMIGIRFPASRPMPSTAMDMSGLSAWPRWPWP